MSYLVQPIIKGGLLVEAGISIILFIYVMFVVQGTKLAYNWMRKKGLPHNVAVYYNRKLIHVFAGGVVALLVPFFFTEPYIPFVLALVLALSVYLPHRKGQLMYWFQVEDNMYEVNFCVMWGVSVLLGWLLLGSPVYGVVPVVFMAFGDAVTGIVRNTLFKRRTKHWTGNLAMLAVCVPIGTALAGAVGAIAGLVASIVERFEWNPIDDNVLISLSSLGVLLIAKALGVI